MAPPSRASEKTFRILHVMSYHSPWRWTDGQFAGFKEGVGDLRAEYKVFQMDTKRNNSPEAKRQKGLEARALIDSWKPDLVYTSDDDAQEFVARAYVGQSLPFVFSGVNAAPAAYGFVGSRNVTGVLEHEHFVESVRLLQSLVPNIRRLLVVLDDAPMWLPVRTRMRSGLAELPGVAVLSWVTVKTFEEYKQMVLDAPGGADAIALIGIFNFKDEAGRNVPYQEVLRWTAENSTLPDLSLWVDRVHFGTLAAVTVSERAQGIAAGQLARGILVDGKPPSSLPMLPTAKGLPVISLARAEKLGIKPRSSVLLTAEVITKFEWDKK